jgi:hypothetical protein
MSGIQSSIKHEIRTTPGKQTNPVTFAKVCPMGHGAQLFTKQTNNYTTEKKNDAKGTCKKNEFNNWKIGLVSL